MEYLLIFFVFFTAENLKSSLLLKVGGFASQSFPLHPLFEVCMLVPFVFRLRAYPDRKYFTKKGISSFLKGSIHHRIHH